MAESRRFLLGIVLLLPSAAAAQESPATRVSAWAPEVRLEQVRVVAKVVDGTATTELEQVFRNTGPVEREEVFLLPLPDDTVVSDLSMTVDGKIVKGEILDRGEARGVYESIVRSRRDPALLEWVGRSCVRLSAFPVPPNGEARVKVRYASVLPLAWGAFEVRVPLSLGPVARGSLKSLVFQAAVEFSRPIGAIYSPTHPVEVVRTGDRSARVSMEGSDVRADRDLRLLVAPAQEEIGLLFLAHRPAGEDGTFLALLSPRLDLEPSKVLPKDVVFVLDTSGSMEGEKIAQAKGALRDALAGLNPGDRFHLVRFATDAEAFREGPVPATPGNVEAARAWIDAFEARGGTNLGDALQRALAVPGEPGRLTMLFLLTDGLPTVGTIEEQTLLAEVRQRNVARARIFVFGVGVDVNTRLLDTLAEETRAAREYVAEGEAIDLKVASLVEKVSHPILSDPLLFLEGAETRDVYPKRLPDLFRGSPLVVAGRFRGEGAASLRLRGRFGDGEREWTYSVNLPAVEARNDSIRATWASRKVGYLLDEIRLHGENTELVEEVKRLAREHGIVTPYTSYLVREERRRLSSTWTGPRSAGVAAGTTPPPDRGSPSDLGNLPRGSTGGWTAGRRVEEGGATAAGVGATGTPTAAPATPDGLPVREPIDREADGVGVGSTGHYGLAASGGKAVEESLEAKRLKEETVGDTTGGFSRTHYGAAFGGRRAAGGSSGGRSGRPVEALQSSVRRVGAKVFHLVASVWMDTAFTEQDREKIVPVAFLSEEYFALLAREPDLAPVFALGPRVLVGWKGKFYEVK